MLHANGRGQSYHHHELAGVAGAQHKAAQCRFVFNLNPDEQEPFSLSTAVPFRLNVRIPIYTLISSENHQLARSCAKVTWRQAAWGKIFPAETPARRETGTMRRARPQLAGRQASHVLFRRIRMRIHLRSFARVTASRKAIRQPPPDRLRPCRTIGRPFVVAFG
jgi:hypothetical protein